MLSAYDDVNLGLGIALPDSKVHILHFSIYYFQILDRICALTLIACSRALLVY